MSRSKRAFKVKPAEKLECPTPEQMAKGNIERVVIINLDSQQRSTVHRVKDCVRQWHDMGLPGFEEPALAAIEWCQERWNARGVIGKLSATYQSTIGTKGGCPERDIEMRDELARIQALFPARYWEVFENVCRWGFAAGDAGAPWSGNNPQAISHARAVVGLVANTIAMQRGMGV